MSPVAAAVRVVSPLVRCPTKVIESAPNRTESDCICPVIVVPSPRRSEYSARTGAWLAPMSTL